MPNNIVNTISFFGKREYLEKIRKEIIGKDSNGSDFLDFEKIIPIPEELRIESSTRIKDSLSAIKELLSRHPSEVSDSVVADLKEAEHNYFVYPEYIRTDAKEAIKAFSVITDEEMQAYAEENPLKYADEDFWKIGKQAYSNIFKYGYPTWYEWAIGRWGTKWNSYSSTVYDITEEDGSCSFSIYFQTAWSMPEGIIRELMNKYPDADIVGGFADEDMWAFNTGFYTTFDCKVNGIPSYTKNKNLRKESFGRGIMVTFDNLDAAHKFSESFWGEPLDLEFKPKGKADGSSEIKIYQTEVRFIAFTGLDELKSMGKEVDFSNYDLVYESKRPKSKSLEMLFYEFNMDHPAGYKGRSLSVSDIVEKDGKFYFCDRTDFKEIKISKGCIAAYEEE